MGDVERNDADLVQLVQGVLEMVQTLGKYKNKQVILVPGDPVIAQVNAQQLKQVVLNIVTNGLDSVEGTGTVKVEVRRRGDQAELLFTDNGCGMTPEILEHLFEPFFTRSRSGHGTGLGLSIVYSIVADHDGHIEATSQGPGRGSQFRVTLPLRAPTKKVARDENDLQRRHAA
jgi:signal transduction histidine kinase